ncbi:MAG TPA: NAD(P)/FAD-dependent oxidoreductase [Lachnospiraceae bacterium]|nr:NAD(P)/FAD-dependent oxidoreductase [Lachnospiraceae bacterium]
MKVIVAGGGPAGMMAAIAAAKCGYQVRLIEKNEKLGKKLFITGKGRCNLTNACDMETVLQNIISNRKFLYSALYGFSNWQTMEFFEELGLKIKTERGGRVFPVSDHSSDVIRVLEKELHSQNVAIHLRTKLTHVLVKDGHVTGIRLSDDTEIFADAVILALGGKSYPSCGADGDGWRIAKTLHMNTVEAEPSLVPLVVRESYAAKLQGLSLKNVRASVYYGDIKLFEEFGEMLFTHFGVSGPLILSASSHIRESMYAQNLRLLIDLKPALDEKQLDDRILRDFGENKNRQFRNSLGKLLPVKLIPVIIELSSVDGEKRVNEITKEERRKLVGLLKALPMTIIGNRGFDEAIITRGGVSVKEINPATLEVKKIKGLYMAGEMLDIDALTGGFNLQIAWSTGYAAGSSIGN